MMRHGPALFAAFTLLFLGAARVCWGDDKAAPKDPGKEVERLIGQLGSDDFDERESATSALGKVGKPALGALQKAAKSSGDAEIRRRAAKLVLVIQDALARPIDLGPHVNQKLDERFHGYHPGNDLAALPKGRQT